MSQITAKQAKGYVKDIELRLEELDNMVSLESIENLYEYLDQQIQSHEPLTEEEREELRKLGWTWGGMERLGRWTMWLKENGDHVCYYGVGHTKAEAERDAFNQWKGARK